MWTQVSGGRGRGGAGLAGWGGHDLKQNKIKAMPDTWKDLKRSPPSLLKSKIVPGRTSPGSFRTGKGVPTQGEAAGKGVPTQEEATVMSTGRWGATGSSLATSPNPPC